MLTSALATQGITSVNVVKDIFLSNLWIWKHQCYPSGQAPKFLSCVRRSSCSLGMFFPQQKTFSSRELNSVYLSGIPLCLASWRFYRHNSYQGNSTWDTTDWTGQIFCSFLLSFPPSPQHTSHYLLTSGRWWGSPSWISESNKTLLKLKHLSKMAQLQRH